MNTTTFIMTFAYNLGSSLPIILLLMGSIFLARKAFINFDLLVDKLRYMSWLYVAAVLLSPIVLMLGRDSKEHFVVIWGYVFHTAILLFGALFIAWIVSLTPANPRRRHR